ILYQNLGDAYLRVGREQDAETQFKLAVQLLEGYLLVNPNDAPVLSQMAICQAKLHQNQNALASTERATRIEPQNTNLMYERAVVHALIGDSDKAIEYLGRALSRGYSSSEAARDPDLETLRNKPEYKSLFETNA
ncbi:MAG TPA: hypothetical protein VJX74_03655, partial [Blastocatellia bacterium]|nr:hypothetical protein [Blastocatellia bacterium]